MAVAVAQHLPRPSDPPAGAAGAACPRPAERCSLGTSQQPQPTPSTIHPRSRQQKSKVQSHRINHKKIDFTISQCTGDHRFWSSARIRLC